MAYLLLYGPGWTQRWQIDDGQLDVVNAAITRLGHSETGRLPILDPGSGESTTLVVAWQHVAAAVVLGADHPEHADRPTPGSTGQYP
ncbi:MAG TPA: hypothetical protein VGK78_08545 [Nocardioides sp.]|uniref:hypothetical protein n=1 Tax=Nocardioides sp. TaxID=35761 RepID=UPI002F41E185